MPVSTRAATKRKTERKKEVTSAIDDLSVAEVRRCLDFIRRTYRDSTETFHIAMPITGTKYSIESFCFKFVKGTHSKRVQK